MHLISFEFFEPALLWIGEHPWLSGFAIFLISLSESLAIVGLFIPGLLMMGAIGALISSGDLPLVPTLIWAILGAIAGDGLSYLLGWYFNDRLNNVWPFSRFPQWLDKGERFFAKHGGKSIIFGRFVGPVRPFVPVVAGMMAMCPRQFFITNVISAILWAPLYMFPGLLAHLTVVNFL